VSGYIPNADAARRAMLDVLGAASAEDLFEAVPEPIRLKRPLNLPSGQSEMETIAHMRRLAGKNTVFSSVFRGAGAYRHYIPAIARRVASKEAFVTAYTPYQAEISQGALQSIFEFQTMICELTGMDAANASVYDGASAAAEAVAMCRGKSRQTVVMSSAAHPHVIETVRTYCAAADEGIAIAPHKDGAMDMDALDGIIDGNTACVYIQQPNFFGRLERADEIAALARQRGTRLIMGCNPIALAILKTPGECGADIAVGEGQPLGLPLSFGGPYLGFMSCVNELTRRLPGRIAGETRDSNGERAFVLTLQAREQHIKREKAASNICSNQALCALTAAAYMAAMGPAGMREAAEQCVSKASYLRARLSEVKGFEPVFGGPFFHEFVTRCPVPPEQLERCLEKEGILCGLPLTGELDGCILWCATELNAKSEIDTLIDLVRRCSG